jgi:hypothetical protein
MSKRKSIEKSVTFSDVVCGRTYHTMGYSSEVLLKEDLVKEDLEDPFKDDYVEDEKAINLCEARRFLDGALMMLTAEEYSLKQFNVAFFRRKWVRLTKVSAVMSIYNRHGGDDFRVEVHNLATKFLDAGGDVPSLLFKKPYEFHIVASHLQVIQSATASEADEKTRGLVSAMVVEIDAKYEKWFVERFEDAVDDIEKEVAELESELAEF